MHVVWHEDRLTVTAAGARRSHVLREIARLTDAVVGGMDAVPDDRVWLRFRNVTVREALRRLLADIPGVVIEDALVDGRLVAVARVFTRPPRRKAVDTSQTADRIAALRGSLAADDVDAVLAAFEVLAADDPARAVFEVLVAARAVDARVRLQALQTLDQAAEADLATVLDAFAAALADADEAVRAQAIDGIAARGGPDSERILREALRTEDVDVRLAVVESIGERDATSALLEESLADEHPDVRAAAAAWLTRHGGER